jgi:hypothetical protein
MIFKVKIIKEHLLTKDIFPLDFETTITQTFHKEKKVFPGFYTEIQKNKVWVPESVINKGDPKDLIIVGKNKLKYSTDVFTNWTGKHFTEFVKKLK